MENSYEGDGSVPWDLSLPPMPPAEEEAEEDRGAMGATFGMTSTSTRLSSRRTARPRQRRAPSAKRRRRRVAKSRRNADGSISWNAPPAPPRRPGAPRASRTTTPCAPRPPKTFRGRGTIPRTIPGRSASNPNLNPSGRSSTNRPRRKRRRRPTTRRNSRGEAEGQPGRIRAVGRVRRRLEAERRDRAAYEGALERADETDEDAPVEEEEEEEETTYTIGEGEGGAVAWSAPEEKRFPRRRRRIPSAKLAMNTGITTASGGGRRIHPRPGGGGVQARLFTAALGDSLVEPDPRRARKRRVVAPCMLSALGGSSGNEPLCQVRGDAKACQTRYFKEQSCWHKTVGARFVDPESTTVGPEERSRPPTRRGDPDRNAAWIKEYYDCMSGGEKYAGSVEAPHRLLQPTSARQVKKHFSAKKKGRTCTCFCTFPKPA